MTRAVALAALLIASSVSQAAERKWELQYFLDEDRSSFKLYDLKFPSQRVGVAVGTMTDDDRGGKPAALITTDGGAQWRVEKLKEVGLSLFFLNDSLGWMVTTKGIWRTQEGGRSWSKISSLRNVLRVYFLSPDRGWAVGLRKSVYETQDGGKKWVKLPAAQEPKTKADQTVYGTIDFATPEAGMIAGWHRAPRRSDRGLPEWIDPAAAELRHEWPGVTIFLQTKDGGKTWTSSTASTFGQVSRLDLSPAGVGLGLVEMTSPMGEWPSEVYRIDWRTGGNQRVFREKAVAITDVAIFSSGVAYIVGIERPGRLRQSPIPGKVRVLRSADLKTWTRMDVDYRATASRATLAGVDGDHVWVGTDTGMILALTEK